MCGSNTNGAAGAFSSAASPPASQRSSSMRAASQAARQCDGRAGELQGGWLLQYTQPGLSSNFPLLLNSRRLVNPAVREGISGEVKQDRARQHLALFFGVPPWFWCVCVWFGTPTCAHTRTIHVHSFSFWIDLCLGFFSLFFWCVCGVCVCCFPTTPGLIQAALPISTTPRSFPLLANPSLHRSIPPPPPPPWSLVWPQPRDLT